MKLFTRFILQMLFPIILLSIGMILVSIMIIYDNLDSWKEAIGGTLENAEIQNLNNRTRNLQMVIQDVFIQINTDLLSLEAYATKILPKKEKDYYRSYDSLNLKDQPKLNIDASSYYISRPGTTLSYFNQSSLLDDIFRAVLKSNQKYSLLYIGFEDGFFRKFPWSTSETYPKLNYTCANNGSNITGYDPVCRSWYKLAKDNQTSVVFTAPYTFAKSGEVAITAAKAILLNNSLVGVIGADISMNYVLKIINQTILTGGKLFIIDMEGNIIFYPGLQREKDKKYTVENMENISLSLINPTKSPILVKNETYQLFSSRISQTNYIFCMIVPIEDIKKTKIEMDDNTTKDIKNVYIIISSILGLFTLIGLIISKYLASIIIGPTKELVDFLDKIVKQDYKHQIKEPGAISKELKKLHIKFQDLLEALKFGNEAYWGGDFKEAMENFTKIENLMMKSDNKRGLGIIYANKANAMRVFCDIDAEVEEVYKKSITIAEELIKERNEYDEKLLKIDLGNRYMNIGVFYMEKKSFSPALYFFNKALKMHREIDNADGITFSIANKAQLYLEAEKYDEAANMLDQVIESEKKKRVVDEGSQKVLQYAYMNYGLLKLNLKEIDEAANYFRLSLNCARYLDRPVLRTCVSNLKMYYEQKGFGQCRLPDYQARKIFEIYDRIFEENFRHIIFVLDASGSMVDRLSLCQKNIKEIIEKRLEPNDRVSLFTFTDDAHLVFENLRIKDQKELIIEFLDSRTTLEGDTAFYRALYTAMQDSKARNQWIIAFTDGEDNASGSITAGFLKKVYPNYMNNLIIVTFEELENEKEIQSLCEEARKYKRIGRHIKVPKDSIQDLDDAFVKLGDILTGIIVMEEF